LAAKEYVRARLGHEFVPATAWVGEDVDAFFAAKLPTGRYFLKLNNGCATNLFLDLPDDLQRRCGEITQKANEWLKSPYGYSWGEWQYSASKPLLFLEEFVDFGGTRAADDFKFYCFNGKVRVIEIIVDRTTQRRAGFYTPAWEHIHVAFRHEPIQRDRPPNLEDMIHVAETIAAGLEFARVDLYSDRKSAIKFGEITFTPGNACLRFSDFRFDRWLGDQFGPGARNWVGQTS
jgi:TupA-like ATPgrasp